MPHTEGAYQYYKTFRAGGPLEWFNAPTGPKSEFFRDVGTEELWAEGARERFRSSVLTIPIVA